LPSPSPPPAGLGVGLSVGASVGAATVGATPVGAGTGDPIGEPLGGLPAGAPTGELAADETPVLGDPSLPPVDAPDASAVGCDSGGEPVADGAVAFPESPELSLGPDPGLGLPESSRELPAAAVPQLHSRTAAHRAAAATARRPHVLLLRLCMLRRWPPVSAEFAATPAVCSRRTMREAAWLPMLKLSHRGLDACHSTLSHKL
jgi:hypothetical protein